MPAPVHISEVIAEIAADWPVMTMPDYTGRASCIACGGSGEHGVRREQETDAWVTVPCPVCLGTGDALLQVLCPSCGHDQYDHAPDGQPPYTCVLRGCHCSRTPDHLVIEAPQVA